MFPNNIPWLISIAMLLLLLLIMDPRYLNSMIFIY
jgi:hypothetical protein